MSGAAPQGSISSIINQCQTLEELTQNALIKAFRASTGQFKVSADTTVASSTTLITDPEFAIPLKKGAQYEVDATLVFTTGATGGLKLQLTAPANTAGTVFIGKVTTNAAGTGAITSLSNNSSLNASLVSAAAAYDTVVIKGFLIPSADDLLTVQFAQNTSNATGVTLLRGSIIRLLQFSSSRRPPNGI